MPEVQWDRRDTVRLSIQWTEETNWHANGGAKLEGVTDSAFPCHTSKCIQLAYLSFQFPFEVNTEQSRWRYDWLNWTRLSKYYMTSHKLLGVIRTCAKCCCRQLCTHFPHTARRMQTNMQGHTLEYTQRWTHTPYSLSHKLWQSCFFFFFICAIHTILFSGSEIVFSWFPASYFCYPLMSIQHILPAIGKGQACWIS